MASRQVRPERERPRAPRPRGREPHGRERGAEVVERLRAVAVRVVARGRAELGLEPGPRRRASSSSAARTRRSRNHVAALPQQRRAVHARDARVSLWPRPRSSARAAARAARRGRARARRRPRPPPPRPSSARARRRGRRAGPAHAERDEQLGAPLPLRPAPRGGTPPSRASALEQLGRPGEGLLEEDHLREPCSEPSTSLWPSASLARARARPRARRPARAPPPPPPPPPRATPTARARARRRPRAARSAAAARARRAPSRRAPLDRHEVPPRAQSGVRGRRAQRCGRAEAPDAQDLAEVRRHVVVVGVAIARRTSDCARVLAARVVREAEQARPASSATARDLLVHRHRARARPPCAARRRARARRAGSSSSCRRPRPRTPARRGATAAGTTWPWAIQTLEQVLSLSFESTQRGALSESSVISS